MASKMAFARLENAHDGEPPAWCASNRRALAKDICSGRYDTTSVITQLATGLCELQSSR